MPDVNLGRIGMLLRGAYNNSTSYVPLDVVTFAGAFWMCLSPCTGIVPENGANWGQIGGSIGHKTNILLNPTFFVNTGNMSGTVTLAAGAAGHDCWRAGAGGCVYTFASTGGVMTLTIVSGSLRQIVDGGNIRTGQYVLSWTGTAQGRIGAAAYSTSPQQSGLAGATNVAIEFGPGTLSSPQLEIGEIPSQFVPRDIDLERMLCGNHYRRLGYAANAFVISGVNYGVGPGNLTARLTLTFPPMRATPSVGIDNIGGFVFTNSSGLVIEGVSSSSVTLKITNGPNTGDFSCACPATGGIILDARI